MELIHHFFELQRSFQRNKVLEDDASSIEAAGACDDKELRGSIFRELQDLAIKQADTQTADQGLSNDGVWGWDDGGWNDNPDGYVAENTGYENGGVVDNQWNEWNTPNESGDSTHKTWRDHVTPNESGDSAHKTWRDHVHDAERISYPVRPGAEDCAFYMKSGSCKFGTNCKFNHPSRNNQFAQGRRYRDNNSEKTGQGLCKYHLSGWCKSGPECKYSHGSDKSSVSQSQIVELNSSGYPIQPGESECEYYMKTGSCKYGAICKFHHPEQAAGAGGSSVSSNSAPRTSRMWKAEHESQTSSTLDWNEKKQQRNNMPVEEYPERPGEPECSFFIKTGDCKFKSNCKFHHPKNRSFRSKTKTDAPAANDKGLPIRPGQSICTYYYQKGVCKYGMACAYDHSSDVTRE